LNLIINYLQKLTIQQIVEDQLEQLPLTRGIKGDFLKLKPSRSLETSKVKKKGPIRGL
jgi:hypothetical protein